MYVSVAELLFAFLLESQSLSSLAKYELEKTSCSFPAVRTHRDADVTLANEKTAQWNTDQSEDKITVPSYLNTFSKCLFPGDENK